MTLVEEIERLREEVAMHSQLRQDNLAMYTAEIARVLKENYDLRTKLDALYAAGHGVRVGCLPHNEGMHTVRSGKLIALNHALDAIRNPKENIDDQEEDREEEGQAGEAGLPADPQSAGGEGDGPSPVPGTSMGEARGAVGGALVAEPSPPPGDPEARRPDGKWCRVENATRCDEHLDQRWLGDRYETCGGCALALNATVIEQARELQALRGHGPMTPDRVEMLSEAARGCSRALVGVSLGQDDAVVDALTGARDALYWVAQRFRPFTQRPLSQFETWAVQRALKDR